MTKTSPWELEPAALYKHCDPGQFAFITTAELTDPAGIIGQEKAHSAVMFGLGIGRAGYNLFVMGPAGTGKHALVRECLQRAPHRADLLDWVYANNFAEPGKPMALGLPAGRGKALREDMRQLVEELRSAIPAAFESEEYRTRVEQIEAEFTKRQETELAQLSKDAGAEHIGLLHTPTGFSLAPLKNGEVMNQDDFNALDKDEQNRIDRILGTLRTRLERLFHQMRLWRREHRDKVKQLNREVSLFAVGSLMEELKARYADLPKIVRYLEAVQEDVIANADDFQRKEDTPGGPFGMSIPEPTFRRYLINVIVERNETDGSSLVYEDNPNLPNLIGRVEHHARFGMLTTDFSLIKAGALHRANGGYLMLDVHKLLAQPYAWEALKRALSKREIRIESLGEMYGLVSTESIEPEPIPLDLKVVLFGERTWYYLLHAWDPDFRELFKVAADFEEDLPRTEQSHALFARMVATVARREKMLPFERRAVARLIEYSARRAGDAAKLSANTMEFTDLLKEADFFAHSSKSEYVLRDHVQQAIDAQFSRADRLRARVHETILRGTLMIDTAGAKIGQINALSVFELGNFAFAEPTRITATTRMGDGHVIDVQREVELGGSIHSKGVMILSAFLAARFSSDRPHSLSASLVFEQTYGTVEGDSASVAELAALMSSLADIPIRQCLAVTGSVNQLGQIQAIGDVNEKIEGFFDICRARHLDGQHGVLIPFANTEHLMLREDIVQAVQDGQFHVYAVSNVDEALELLTGISAGSPDRSGHWPPGSVNACVASRLQKFSALRLAYAGAEKRRVSTRGATRPK